MSTTKDTDRDETRVAEAVRLVLRRYSDQLRRRPAMAAAALLLPAIGDVLTYYAPPLVVARLLGRSARSESLTAAELAPYVFTFAGLWLGGQIVCRIAVACISRVEIRGIEALYLEAMDELPAKDLAF